MLRFIAFGLIVIATDTLHASAKRDRIEDPHSDQLDPYKRSGLSPEDDFNAQDFAAIDNLIERHVENKRSKCLLNTPLIDELDAQDIEAADSAEKLYNSEYIETTDLAVAHYYSKKHKGESSESYEEDESHSGRTAPEEPANRMEESDNEQEMLQICEELEAELYQLAEEAEAEVHQNEECENLVYSSGRLDEEDYEVEMLELCEEVELELYELQEKERASCEDYEEDEAEELSYYELMFYEYQEEQKYDTPWFLKNPLGFEGKLLKSNNDHQKYMLEAIKKARNKILITSHNFSANPQNHRGLFAALRQASEKGVKVMLYHHKGGLGLESDLPESIKRHQVNCHSKVFAVDKAVLAIGSFDWLQDPTYVYAESLNESIAFEDYTFMPFIKNVWRTAKMYKHVTSSPGSKSQINSIYENSAPEVITLENEEGVELVQTPQRHRELFHQAFRKASYRIAVCASVVIDNPKFLEQYLPIDLVSHFLASACSGFHSGGNKVLEIFYNPKGRIGGRTNREILDAHLENVIGRPNLILTPVENMHQKSLTVDNNYYMMGSFNLLSSAQNVLDKTHRMETSVLLTGSAASVLLDKFHF